MVEFFNLQIKATAWCCKHKQSQQFFEMTKGIERTICEEGFYCEENNICFLALLALQEIIQ